MTTGFHFNHHHLVMVLLFVLLYGLTSTVYVHRAKKEAVRDFHNHTAFIADDVWALNPDGAGAYLQLALRTQHFRELTISIPGDEAFLHLVSPPLRGVSGALHRLGLIGERRLESGIVYRGMEIGTLYGTQYVRVVYPLLNLFSLHLLLLLVAMVIYSLARRRKVLERIVEERTRNLRKSERRFHDLVNLLPEMIVETDTSGTITYANREAKERFGLAVGAGNRSNLFDAVQRKEEEGGAHFVQALKSGDTSLKEYTARGADGKSFPLLLCASAIVENGLVAGARVVGIDITERHRMEQQLRKDQKMKTIGLMAGGVAHDLNNILSGIVTYPELLLLDLPQDSSLRKPLERIRTAGLDASEVVADLLTVARGVVVEKEVVLVNSLVEDYLQSPDFMELHTRHPAVSISTRLDSALGNIACSPIHIRKCLMNLVTNGAEAINGSGSVSIRTGNLQVNPQEAEKLGLQHGGSYVTLSVSDTGLGIAQEEIGQIFEPFFTKKSMGRSGTGLGLTVVWNIVCDHEGAVQVNSTAEGTTFTLYFPHAAKPITENAPDNMVHMLRGDGEQVLVVDDDPRQREIATTLLHTLGYASVAVSSGEEAIAYLSEHRADVMLVDMLMEPGQLNGRQTYEEVVRMHPGQKAIIVSGYAEDEDVQLSLQCGAGGFLAKPYTLVQLGTMVRSVLFP